MTIDYDRIVDETAARLAWDNYPIDACMHHMAAQWQKARGEVGGFQLFVGDVMAALISPAIERMKAARPFDTTEPLHWVSIGDSVKAGDPVEVGGEARTIYVVRRDHIGRRMGRISPSYFRDGLPAIESEETDG